MFYPIIIFLLAVWGFFVCKKIYHEKRENKPMVCPLGADCHGVVTSEFSKFFGIGLEIHGIIYYIFIGISYLALQIYEPLYNVPVLFVLFGISMAGFFFSLYLTFVQAFYLKNWCTWCLTSALITTLIFGVSLYGILINGITFIPLLATIAPIIVIAHLFGFALGVGGATINDILFFKFLKDFRISEEENKILKTMSQIIWVGILIAVISGIGLYLPNADVLHTSSKFLVKVVVVLVIIVNGAFLNLVIAPSLTKMSFKDDGLNTKKAHGLRKAAFVSGGISFVSWYSAFILGVLDGVPLSFTNLFMVYLGLLSVVSVGALIVEKFYCGNGHKKCLK